MSRPVGKLAVAAVGIALFALSLRLAAGSLSPVIDRLAVDFPMPAALVGLIGMAPPIAFAIAGMLTPQLERRLGLDRLILLAAAITTAGLAARALAPEAWSLLGATTVLFLAVGVGNVLLPGAVKKYFPTRIGTMTAVYSTAMSVGSFVPPLVAVPLADTLGWRMSFFVWAAMAGASLIPWLALALGARATPADDLPEPRGVIVRRLVRSRLAWAMAVTFMASSSIAYAAFAWLPSILVDTAGSTAPEAGALLGLWATIGVPSSFIVPLVLGRRYAVGVLYAVSVTAGAVSVAGLILAPSGATVVWVVLLGIAPLLFPMLLSLVGMRTRTQESAVALSAFVQSIGYAATGLVPLAIGVLHEATGGWTASLILLGTVILLAAPAGFVVARGGSIEEEWERRHGPW